MAAVANNPTFAKKVGIAQSVGKDFSEADKGRKFNKGGDMKKEMKAAGIFAKAGEKKLAAHERREAMGEEKDTPAIAKKEMSVLKKSKAPKDVMDYEEAEHKSMGFKKGGMTKKYAKGGGIESKGKTKVKKYAKGGGIKKFAEGGDDELSLDNMSLSEARNVARNMVEMNGDPSLKHFTWRGQKYAISPSTAPRPAASAAASPAPAARRFADQKPDTSEMFTRGVSGQLGDTSGGYRGQQDSPASFARQQAAQAAKDKQDRADFEKRFSGALGGANLTALDIAGLGGGAARKAGQAATEAAEAAMRGRNLRSRLTRTMNNDKKMAAENFDRTRSNRINDYAANFRSRGAPNEADKADRMARDLEETYSRYKKGGSVKKFAKGGGIESKGKTRGRFI